MEGIKSRARWGGGIGGRRRAGGEREEKGKDGMLPENRNRQKGGLKFLPSFKIQHNKYSKIMKFGVPRQE